MKQREFQYSLILTVKGKSSSPPRLKMSVEAFLLESVLPLMQELKTEKEQMEICIEWVDSEETRKS